MLFIIRVNFIDDVNENIDLLRKFKVIESCLNLLLRLKKSQTEKFST